MLRVVPVFLAIIVLNGCALFSETTETETQVAAQTITSVPPAPDSTTKTDSPPLIRKHILVVPFSNTTPLGGSELAEYATDYVRDRISKIPELVSTPETEIEGWQALQGDKLTPEFHMAMERAQNQGLSAIITGSIDQVFINRKGDEVGLFRSHQIISGATLKFEVFDLSLSKSLLNRLTSSEQHEELTEFFLNKEENGFDLPRAKISVQKALDKVLGDLAAYAKRIDWNGRIAKVDIDRYYINGGELTGISKGQLLKVFSDGQNVADPDNQASIGFAPGRFKGFLRVIDFFGEDGAVAVIHSGGNFRERDRLRLVTSQK